MLAVGRRARAPVLGNEPPVVGEERAQPVGDRDGIVDETVDVARPGGEGGDGHRTFDAGRPRTFPRMAVRAVILLTLIAWP